MLVTLTGDNYYLLKAELDKYKDQFGGDNNDLSITTLNGGEVSLEDIKMELSAYSLFSDKRLIILNEPSAVKGFDEYIAELEANLPETTSVVIVEPSLDKRKSYYKYLLKSTDFKQFNKLNGPTLISWLQQEAKASGAAISADTASYLIDRTSDDQLMLAQEISKLSLYSSEITRKTIDLLVEPSPSSTIFELLDAAFNLNSKKALNIYGEQRMQKVEPDQILAMLSWQLNILALYMTSRNLSDSEIISSSNLSPFTLSKAKRIATNVTIGNLRSLVSELTNLDLSYKTASLDLDEGLKNFIVSLAV